jgi:hypothetical protein
MTVGRDQGTGNRIRFRKLANGNWRGIGNIINKMKQ